MNLLELPARGVGATQAATQAGGFGGPTQLQQTQTQVGVVPCGAVLRVCVLSLGLTEAMQVCVGCAVGGAAGAVVVGGDSLWRLLLVAAAAVVSVPPC